MDKAPRRYVVAYEYHLDGIVLHLACGHTVKIARQSAPSKRVRCPVCLFGRNPDAYHRNASSH